jgi:prolipoprotein diacylglyceryltransferase
VAGSGWLYVAAYTVGRAWVEWLRVDQANHILGLRLNDWTCLIVFLGTLAVLLWPRRSVGEVEDSPAVSTPEHDHT